MLLLTSPLQTYVLQKLHCSEIEDELYFEFDLWQV